MGGYLGGKRPLGKPRNRRGMLFGGMPQIRSRYLTGRRKHERQVVVVRRSGRPWIENGPKPHRRRKRKK